MKPVYILIFLPIILTACAEKSGESASSELGSPELILSEESWSTPKKSDSLLLASKRGEEAILKELSEAGFDKLRNEQYNTFSAKLPFRDSFPEFIFTPYNILSDSLQRQFPEIKFYQGSSRSDPLNTVMLSLSDEHVSFRFEDGLKRLSQMDDYENMFELLDAEDVAYQFREQDLLQQNNVPLTKSRTRKSVSNVQYVKMIKVAISATGEYTAAFGSSYLAWREILEVVTSVSRIFNLELGVRLQLVSGPTTVYSDSINDPFDNYDIGQCVVANQNVLDTVYGKNAYDLGHIFTTDTAGGAAQTGGILYAKLKVYFQALLKLFFSASHFRWTMSPTKWGISWERITFLMA